MMTNFNLITRFLYNLRLTYHVWLGRLLWYRSDKRYYCFIPVNRAKRKTIINIRTLKEFYLIIIIVLGKCIYKIGQNPKFYSDCRYKLVNPCHQISFARRFSILMSYLVINSFSTLGLFVCMSMCVCMCVSAFQISPMTNDRDAHNSKLLSRYYGLS